MGSKSPDGHQQGPNGHGSPDFKPAKIVNASSSGSSSADVDRGIVDEDDGDADDSDEEAGLKQPQAASEKKNKKRKKPKKKKAKVPAGATVQTTPPTVPVTSLFPSGYNKGQLIPYDNTRRITDEEKRYTSHLFSETFLNDYRRAAEVHRQVRQHAQKEIIKPGASMSTIANAIEEGVYALLGNPCTQPGDRLKSGPGFPTGLCLNHLAAHWTPNAGGKEILLQKSDVLSVDFGVHVNGHIVDSAFTICFDETYDPLLAAVRAATNTGIALAGVDARMKDIGAAVQEVMESYEVVLGGGKVLPVKAVKSLTGHSILPYRIHGDKQVPFVRNDSKQIMEEGDVFAIETFGSTGRGVMMDDVGVYGYSRNEGVTGQYLQSASAKALLKTIDANFATIPFSRAHLERLGVKKYHLGMRQLVDAGIVEEYAPLIDQKGSMVAQFEHTVLLHSGGKEVLSRGEDY